MQTSVTVTTFIGCPNTDVSQTIAHLLKTSNESTLKAIVPKHIKHWRGKQNIKNVIPVAKRLTRLGQGSSSCLIRGDIHFIIKQLATEESCKHIIIQALQNTDFTILAKTFTVANHEGFILSDIAQLTNMTIVIDTRLILDLLYSKNARYFIEQIEFANMLLLNKYLEVSKEDLEHIINVLRALNPNADIKTNKVEDLSLSSLQATYPIDLDQVQPRSSLSKIQDEDVHKYPMISYMTYTARKPFHSQRLQAFFAKQWRSIVRAQGIFWVAARPNEARVLDIAGGSWITSEGGDWWALVPSSQRPKTESFRSQIESIWHPTFADRKQELNFVGATLDQDELRAQLDQCLLTEIELAEIDTHTWHTN